ncbi:hypothetical protein KCP69_26165 [Salmonella enterica subsp. enterica]|nr:hypothetical protein KCP69_26165 [Salmonella enterica subsp. enterica]
MRLNLLPSALSVPTRAPPIDQTSKRRRHHHTAPHPPTFVPIKHSVKTAGYCSAQTAGDFQLAEIRWLGDAPRQTDIKRLITVGNPPNHIPSRQLAYYRRATLIRWHPAVRFRHFH